MNNKNRRDFLKILGLAPLFAATASFAEDTTKPHIVIVGGGFSGSTCAKYLKLWGGHSVDVSIIESSRSYVSPILSNLVLNNQKSISSLTFNLLELESKYEVNVIYSDVLNVNNDSNSLTLSNGTVVSYDKLVLAAGIDFIKTNDYDFSNVPHAWKAGEQTLNLKNKIDSMVNGDTFTMSIPPAPYRCPPGPYERACVVADYLKNVKGYNDCVVNVLDANANVTVEADTFLAKFNEYGVNYVPNCTVEFVNDQNNTITYNEGGASKNITSEVLNVIPEHKAASIIFQAGVNSGNWAPVNPLSYESIIINGIYVIGDSQGTGQPKAGHIANSEAKVCADAILRTINNVPLYADPKTTSACYSPTSTTEASWLSAVFKYDPGQEKMVISNIDSGDSSVSNYSEMFNWSGNLFKDTFS